MNKSYNTDGIDDPTKLWLQTLVHSIKNKQWGIGKVIRWYPAIDGMPPRIRVMFEAHSSPQLLFVNDVKRIES